MSAVTSALFRADTTAAEFEYWWHAPGDWVEAPNERRAGWSGMLRVAHRGECVYVKRQRNHLCRTLLHPLGWPTASREWHYLQRLRELGIPAPTPLFHGSMRTAAGVDALLVTETLHGFTPLSAQNDLPWPRRGILARAVGRLLGRLHRSRLQHGCLYDKHIMVRWVGTVPVVALIDLEKMRPRASRRAAARRDLDQLRRHQTLWSEAEWALLEQSHSAALADFSA